MYITNYRIVFNWQLATFTKIDNIFNTKYSLVHFSEIISKTAVQKENISNEKSYKIVGVKSYGKGAYLNRTVKGNTLTMKQYQVCSIDYLIWCKVDTKNGAFGIITKEFEGCYASSNMSLAKIDTAKIDLEYFQLIFKYPVFNKYMDRLAVGSTNRKYLSFEQILNQIKISLPPLNIQEKLVKSYQHKLAKAIEAERKAKELEEGIETYLLRELGIEKAKKIDINKKLTIVNSKKITEWSVDNILFKEVLKSTKYAFSPLKKDNYIVDVFRGKSPKYEDGGTAIILNQKCNRWNEIKLEFAKKVNEPWLSNINPKNKTKENDILINSTGDGTIGRSSLVTNQFENLIYDSHILLLRLNQALVNPSFMVYLFNSVFIQEQINKLKSAQSTKQTELGLENLFKIKFIIPPRTYTANGKIDEIKDIQTQIVNHITAQNEAIKRLKNEAETLRNAAKQEFEKEIFGH